MSKNPANVSRKKAAGKQHPVKDLDGRLDGRVRKGDGDLKDFVKRAHKP